MKGVFSCLLALLLLAGCAAPQAAPSVPVDSSLTVHFIDVGQADCALLECDGQYMLIDGGNIADSSLVVSYLQRQGVSELSLAVCTHAHEDHVGGLPGVLAVFPVNAVWSPTKTYSSKCYDDFVYYTGQQGLEITIPSVGDSFSLGAAQVTVLGPVKTYADTNNTSLVLMVQFGQNRFLFTGDMETAAETDMLDAGIQVKADVLKVGHHGSDTSTGYRFLYEAEPAYAIISVGAGNDYGHPHKEPLSRLQDAGVQVFRTDRLGTVVAQSNGETVAFTWENTAVQPEAPTGEKPEYYIGNKNSRVLHRPSCSGLPSEKNQVRFASLSDALAAGYSPCSRCMP